MLLSPQFPRVFASLIMNDCITVSEPGTAIDTVKFDYEILPYP